MKANNEQELAKAIMNGESRIELAESLVSGVSNILNPSEMAWDAVLAALVASSFFWAGTSIVVGLAIGLPAVLAVCGGVGGVVFVTLGAQGTLCAYRLLIATKDIEVLKKLRTYELEGNVINKNV